MIIPALDIIHGKVVRLFQGSYNMKSHYGDPFVYLNKYIRQGAKIIHLIDLDGAKNPKNRQIKLIHQLIQKATPYTKIQIGGGIRSAKDIEILLKLGVKRVILGSVSITQSKLVKQWFNYFNPNSLVLATDVRIHTNGDQKIAVYGWQKQTNISLQKIIEIYNLHGLKHVLCTDISKDGTLSGSNIPLYQSICQKWPKIKFQASGGIHTLAEISKLHQSGINNIIIGKALLEKKFTLSEAMSCWQKE